MDIFNHKEEAILFNNPRSSPIKRINSTPATPSSSPRTTKSIARDRFIPSRSAMDLDISHFQLVKENSGSNSASDTTPSQEHYKQLLANSLFDGKMPTGRETPQTPTKILPMHSNPAVTKSEHSPYRANYSYSVANPMSPTIQSPAASPKKTARIIPQNPEKILDAPQLVDDYYLNLLDWSHSNVVGIALASSAYLWNASNGQSSELMHNDDPGDPIMSISFSKQGQYVALGMADGTIQIWDYEKQALLRTMGGHTGRVVSLDWYNHNLASGSRNGMIYNHDVRIANHVVSFLENHTQEVCGLKWAPDGAYLASGGNDNLLNVWDVHNDEKPIYSFDHHVAAVKALAWCPFQRSLLASGGGTADRCIRFWNTATGSCINTVDTKSQVCAIQWSKHSKELVTSHGYSQNQLTVWKYPTMTKITELKGHTSRVLHLALSPDSTTVASAAGDETLRFWKVFEPANHKPEQSTPYKSLMKGMFIR